MAEHVSDAMLLERFVACGQQDAFATLMRRHGPRVLAACRRILPSEHDAEDVFQATFLVLALKAAEVPWEGSVGGWLCGVARRLSLNARAGASKRSRRETPVAALAGFGSGRGGGPIPEAYHPQADPFAEISRREVRRVLDHELSRLPAKYRAPVVLCDLEGMTHEEAARRLGWPSGSISGRLKQARALLRQRLAGRDLPAAMLLLVGALVAVWASGRGPGAAERPVAVRESRAPFERAGTIDHDLGRLLAWIGRGDQPAPTRDELMRAARRAVLVAEQVEAHDPVRTSSAWRSYGLSRTALQASWAATSTDDGALVAAARRLNESCVECHLAFRE